MPCVRIVVTSAFAGLLLVLTTIGTATSAIADSSLRVTRKAVKVSSQGRSFTALLVQPTGSAPGAYPVVAFGHGFIQSPSRYASTLTALAARGYVVIAPFSKTGFLPSHSALAKDLGAAISWAHATQPNADPTLDAVLGHSMGGGAALLAAAADPDIDSVATLAAAETRPSAVTAAKAITVPALFVVGSSDSVVKAADRTGLETVAGIAPDSSESDYRLFQSLQQPSADRKSAST